MFSYIFSAHVSIFLKSYDLEKFKNIFKKTYQTEWKYGTIADFLVAALQKLSSIDFFCSFLMDVWVLKFA